MIIQGSEKECKTSRNLHRREFWNAYGGYSVLVHIYVEIWHSMEVWYASDLKSVDSSRNQLWRAIGILWWNSHAWSKNGHTSRDRHDESCWKQWLGVSLSWSILWISKGHLRNLAWIIYACWLAVLMYREFRFRDKCLILWLYSGKWKKNAKILCYRHRRESWSA